MKSHLQNMNAPMMEPFYLCIRCCQSFYFDTLIKKWGYTMCFENFWIKIPQSHQRPHTPVWPTKPRVNQPLYFSPN